MSRIFHSVKKLFLNIVIYIFFIFKNYLKMFLKFLNEKKLQCTKDKFEESNL